MGRVPRDFRSCIWQKHRSNSSDRPMTSSLCLGPGDEVCLKAGRHLRRHLTRPDGLFVISQQKHPPETLQDGNSRFSSSGHDVVHSSTIKKFGLDQDNHHRQHHQPQSIFGHIEAKHQSRCGEPARGKVPSIGRAKIGHYAPTTTGRLTLWWWWWLLLR